MSKLLILFIIIPVVEMILLIKVGGLIGIFPTIGLVVLTAFIGVWLLRLQGLSTWIRLQEKLARGEAPGVELLEGIMLIIGGALLLTPGFFTDGVGFICLIPQLRKPVANWLISRHFLYRMAGQQKGESRFTWSTTTMRTTSTDGHQEVEGEFTVVRNNDDKTRQASIPMNKEEHNDE